MLLEKEESFCVFVRIVNITVSLMMMTFSEFTYIWLTLALHVTPPVIKSSLFVSSWTACPRNQRILPTRRLHRKISRNALSSIDEEEPYILNQPIESGKSQPSNLDQSFLGSLYQQLMEKAGSIDDSRYSIPEISSGQVPTLFSNLSYKKVEKEGELIASASHDSGSVLSAAALIAGTTIGAGALAIPAATVSSGFLPSTGALLVSWFYMTISGLLIAELVINRIGQTGRVGVGLLELFAKNLGGTVGSIGAIAYFFLHYAVMVAYIFQGGSNLGTALDSVGLGYMSSIPGFDQTLYAAMIGLFAYFAKPSIAQGVNNVLVIGTIASFVAIIQSAWDLADFQALVASENQHPELVVNAFPILFLAMVFQNVVPEVVSRLECDRKKITTSIIMGTTIPALLYITWNAIILGNVMSLPDALNGTLDPIALLQNEGHAGPLLSSLVNIFSELAVTTSFIGFIYGIIGAFSDITLSQSNDSSKPLSTTKYQTLKPAFFAAALLPPLALSIGDPDIFFNALDYGGAFGVSTLFLVLPPLMIWKLRYGNEKGREEPLTVKPMVPFGKIPLASMWKAAATLIIEQGAEKLGILDFLKNLWDNIS